MGIAKPFMKLLIVTLALCSLTGAIANRIAIEPNPKPVPSDWTVVGRSPAAQKMELLFGVKQQNLDQLEKALLQSSDPTSPQYGQHLTNLQVHDMIAPSSQNLNVVYEWLQSHGITAQPASPNHDWIRALVTIGQAEELLQAEYHQIFHPESNATAHRLLESYQLPESVAAALDLVAPTVHIPPAAAKPPISPNQELSPHFGNSPKHLRELYSVDTEGQAADNKMAVTAFIGQKYSKGDLHEFWNLFCSGITCGKGDPILQGDATTGLLSGTESMLDIETITGIAGNVTSEFWGYAGHADGTQNEPFFKWLSMLANTSDQAVPKVFSTSYGEDEAAWSLSAATRMNVEFQKAGARGISLLYASGDEGSNCKKEKFVPETPGSSPWVTAVGGTGGSAPEYAVTLSSGGFSDRWAQPSWQAGAVKQYLSGTGLPASSRGYNTSGRAYPDISAQAIGFTVVVNRIPEPGIAGTSCASPTAAGVIALLNDARLLAGKSTLGFLNPFIYSQSAEFNDILKGASNGCDDENGWPAATGWDAVTGVGTPNYKKLVAAALALP